MDEDEVRLFSAWDDTMSGSHCAMQIAEDEETPGHHDAAEWMLKCMTVVVSDHDGKVRKFRIESADVVEVEVKP